MHSPWPHEHSGSRAAPGAVPVPVSSSFRCPCKGTATGGSGGLFCQGLKPCVSHSRAHGVLSSAVLGFSRESASVCEQLPSWGPQTWPGPGARCDLSLWVSHCNSLLPQSTV